MNQDTNCYECGSTITLNKFPDKYAGVYECQKNGCGVSFMCEHVDTHKEDIDVLVMRNGEADTYESSVTLCDTCGVAVENDDDDDGPEYEYDA